MSYQQTGIVTEADLKKAKLLPSLQRFNKGPVVIIECVENIPCNPCVDACARKVITIKGAITNIPQADFNKCNGCKVCIARCPGLAIFVVHKNFSNKEAAISIPYEFSPKPQKDDIVDSLDRTGKKVCKAKVIQVLDAKALDRCAVITVTVPKRYYNKVRFIKRRAK